jgi:hypothetical protein
MSGADNNVEKLTGRRSMTVGEFARAHADVLNARESVTSADERSNSRQGLSVAWERTNLAQSYEGDPQAEHS